MLKFFNYKTSKILCFQMHSTNSAFWHHLSLDKQRAKPFIRYSSSAKKLIALGFSHGMFLSLEEAVMCSILG